MKLRHWIVAGTAFVSATALAGGDKQRQTQSEPQSQPTAASSQQQSQSQSGQHQQQSGAGQSQDVVKEAQEKLSAMGHDVGPADGIAGPKTQAAVMEFQQSKGLNATGRLDSQTLAALQEGGSSSGTRGSSSSGSQSGGASSNQPGTSGASSSPSSATSHDSSTQAPSSQRSQDVDARSKSEKAPNTK